MHNTRLYQRNITQSARPRCRAGSRLPACLIAAAVLGLLLPTTGTGQQPDGEIRAILQDMLARRHNFKPDQLHALGQRGLVEVLDELLPDTASPKKSEVPDKQIDALIEQLGDANFRIRELASQRLAQLGPGITPHLVEVAKHPDADVSWRAVQLLRRWETRKYEDKSRYVPAFSVYVAGIRDDDRLREMIRRCRLALEAGAPTQGRSSILRLCIMTVALVGNDEYTDRFKPLLAHEDVKVAVLVAQAVGQTARSNSSGTYFPSLMIDALKSDRSEVVSAVIGYVDPCNDPAQEAEVKRLLIALFEGKDDELKFQACRPLLLGHQYTPAMTYVLKQIGSDDRSLKYTALSLLCDSYFQDKPIDKPTLDVALPLLKSVDNNIRRMAVRMLALRSGDEIAERLIPLIADKYSTVRRDVERRLIAHGDRELVRKRLSEIAEKDAASKLGKAAAKLLPKIPYRLKPPE